MAFGWKLVGDGKPLPLGAVVRPDERLSWPKTIGVGAQHVVAMFGATFVFPLIMGLDPNLAIMMSGVSRSCSCWSLPTRSRPTSAPRHRIGVRRRGECAPAISWSVRPPTADWLRPGNR